MSLVSEHTIRRHIASLLSGVSDPELPGLSIVDLGMVIDIRREQDHWCIDLAPTYSGCPAIDVIPILVYTHLDINGYPNTQVNMVLSPPWSTDWISPTGHRKLHEYGIAPPHGRVSDFADEGRPRACPQCGSSHTELISRYGSTACKAAYKCLTCLEPFEYFKCY